MTLTSPAFTDGMSFPADNTCAGTNVSPELDWTAGPAGTMSYAIILTDTTINLVHWVIWDIPASLRSLPAMLASDAMLASPAGARQASFNGNTSHGFTGPCPNGSLHTYQFTVYAVSAATLSTLSTTSTTTAARTAILASSLGMGTLTGTSNATRGD
jgi:Raf kinase inhibitor-like YbhB/YbcL family protein